MPDQVRHDVGLWTVKILSKNVEIHIFFITFCAEGALFSIQIILKCRKPVAADLSAQNSV